MAQHSPPSAEVSGLLAAVSGVFVAVLPVVYLGAGEFGVGPIGFAVLLMEVVTGVVGLGLIGAGVHSSRTGDPRPVVAAVAILGSSAVVGGTGAYVEMSRGPLVPIPAWVVAGLLALGASLGVTERLTG